ncbi:hypothetical protein GCM10023314_14920 [Algibacter agarivorans]|uniref:Glycosyl transferase family 1 domain-containing protein n=1 Tax=Algibacter agarivorans TaxID=1109741 RepID=A0ABP9GQ97_9FLAO
MKNLLYIGNKLSSKGKTQTSIETLGKLLEAEGFIVNTASSKSNKLLRLLDMMFSVLKYRKQVDFVLIDTYSTSNFYYAYIVSQLCRLLKLEYIPILRGGNLPSRLEKSPILSKAIFRNANTNVAPSLYMKSNFEDLGYGNIECIPNSIALKNYRFKERTFSKISLLWVRSFSKIYNPLLAVKVIKALKDENIEAELCMVGPDADGSMQKARLLAEELDVDVTFTDKLSKQDWITLSESYNVFINTTNFDNMPVSVIEAMALGLPVISTNVGGVPFLIEHNKTGVLVTPNSEEAFVKSIKELIDSPDKTKEIGRLARKQAALFDWEIVKNQWIKVLQ